MKKTVNKESTIKRILDKCNSSIGHYIDIEKFNKRSNDVKFLTDACVFLGIPVIYNQ